jgi:palmitoyltransferase ZDHHC1/11
VTPHLEPGTAPSSVDPDAAGHAERANKAKKPVKISAWKLAKLDSNEAIKAAAKARASSSVLRPLDASRQGPYGDLSSSGNASMRSNLSVDYSATKHKRIDKRLSSLQDSYPQSLASQDDYESGTHSASSISSPVHHKPAPHTQVNVPPRAPPQPPRPVAVAQRPPVPTTQITKPMFQSASYYNRENRKVSVVWDQEAGRYVTVAPAPTRPGASGVDLAARTPHFLANAGGEPSNRGKTQSPVNVPSSTLPSGQPSERLTYTGQSIFFGGPLLGAAADRRRNEGGTRAQTEERREPSAHQHDTGTERRRTAEPFPVFAPGAIQKNPPFNR